MLACSMYIVPRFISHYIYSAKIAPSICSRPSPNAKGAKTDKKKTEYTKSTEIKLNREIDGDKEWRNESMCRTSGNTRRKNTGYSFNSEIFFVIFLVVLFDVKKHTHTHKHWKFLKILTNSSQRSWTVYCLRRLENHRNFQFNAKT